MRVYFHYCLPGFSNCYCLAQDKRALIIDPGAMDIELLNMIEKNNLNLDAILLTHSHKHHIGGLETILKVYRTEIYAASEKYATVMLHDGDTVKIGPFSVKASLVPGHSSDSMVFHIENMLFTGDALSAGLKGSTVSAYGEKMQMAALQSKVFSLPEETVIFPGHGPPSTIEVEKRYNIK
jgi:glyoxylase-like metal-dependent hydrolase (beta-lactamase superfamily II)